MNILYNYFKRNIILFLLNSPIFNLFYFLLIVARGRKILPQGPLQICLIVCKLLEAKIKGNRVSEQKMNLSAATCLTHRSLTAAAIEVIDRATRLHL